MFDAYSGRDLTAGQIVSPPVNFSPEFGNIHVQEFIDSLIDFGNYAFVAGQGEGAEREIVTVGGETSGLDKHVIFVDARDVENAADLFSRGEAKLAERQRVLSLQSEVLIVGPFAYQQDWEVGDLVTVQNKNWGLTMDSRVTEVEEIYEAGVFRLNVTFGYNLPSLSKKLKTALGEFKIESAR